LKKKSRIENVFKQKAKTEIEKITAIIIVVVVVVFSIFLLIFICYLLFVVYYCFSCRMASFFSGCISSRHGEYLPGRDLPTEVCIYPSPQTLSLRLFFLFYIFSLHLLLSLSANPRYHTRNNPCTHPPILHDIRR
jgi:hypothetical protein